MNTVIVRDAKHMMILPPYNGFLLIAGQHGNLLFMRSGTFPCSD